VLVQQQQVNGLFSGVADDFTDLIGAVVEFLRNNCVIAVALFNDHLTDFNPSVTESQSKAFAQTGHVPMAEK